MAPTERKHYIGCYRKFRRQEWKHWSRELGRCHSSRRTKVKHPAPAARLTHRRVGSTPAGTSISILQVQLALAWRAPLYNCKQSLNRFHISQLACLYIISRRSIQKISMAKKQQQQALPLCTAFLLVAMLVVTAMHAVPAQAGRLQLQPRSGHMCHPISFHLLICRENIDWLRLRPAEPRQHAFYGSRPPIHQARLQTHLPVPRPACCKYCCNAMSLLSF
jgi:hypothetical protein